MPRGQYCGTERIQRLDRVTGIPVVQVTSMFTPSVHMHYETVTFTPDNGWMIFLSTRSTETGAPMNLFRASSDGKDVVQLSGDSAVSNVVMAEDGSAAFYMQDGAVHRTEIRTAKDEIAVPLRTGELRPHSATHGMLSMGRYYFAELRSNSCAGIGRWDLETGQFTEVIRCDNTGHLKANPAGPEISFNVYEYREGTNEKGTRNFVKTEEYRHAESLERIEVTFPKGRHGIAHSYWLGGTGRYQGTLQWPERGIAIMERDAPEPEIIPSPGPYFWHSGSSYDGDWIIADTNFPYEGIWLVNVTTGKKELLCRPPLPDGADKVDKPLAHPHPNLSHDGSRAVFTFSDDRSIPQVFVVKIPGDVRRRLGTRNGATREGGMESQVGF